MKPKRSPLKITWSVRQQCISLHEFSQSFLLILACVEKVCRQAIIFNYRKTPELNDFFSRLEQHIPTGGNIALIIGDYLFGKLTLEYIAKRHNNLKYFVNIGKQ